MRLSIRIGGFSRVYCYRKSSLKNLFKAGYLVREVIKELVLFIDTLRRGRLLELVNNPNQFILKYLKRFNVDD